VARVGFTSGTAAIALVAFAFGTPILRSHALARLAVAPEDWRPSRVEAGEFPKSVTEPVGGRYQLARPPQRIASQALASDEILLELIGASRLNAVTPWLDDPLSSLSASRAPDRRTARLAAATEDIIALRPDLVVVASYSNADFALQLLQSGIPILRLGPQNSFRDIMVNIRMLGRAVGAESAAEALIARLQSQIARVQGVRPKRAARVLVYTFGFSVGTGTLQDEMIELAGGYNAARDLGSAGIFPLSIESALALQPDLVVTLAGSTQVEDAAGHRLPEALQKGLRAARLGAVVGLPHARFQSVSHHAVSGLEDLHTVLLREFSKL
jgi:iron complex transport system substrate-binding protein